MSRPAIAMRFYRKTFIIIPLLWLFSIVCILYTVTPDGEQTGERTYGRNAWAIIIAEKQIQTLRSQNVELNLLVEKFRNITTTTTTTRIGTPDHYPDKSTLRHDNEQFRSGERFITQHKLPPSKATIEIEQNRRILEDDIDEYLMFIKARLRALRTMTMSKQNSLGAVNETINTILNETFGYRKALRRDFDKLRDSSPFGDKSGGNKSDNWRLRESLKLGELVQKRLLRLQNPKNCLSAKKLVCGLNKRCGYGCQLHHVTYCLFVAYATERTMILKSQGWRYAKDGWQTVFLPLSDTCTNISDDTKHTEWTGDSAVQNAHVVDLPITDSLHNRPEYLPLAVPDDLADRIMLFHGDPAVWWIGQLVKYLTRPQPYLMTDLENTEKNLGFKAPIVGVHIRRTDKISSHEAAKHELAEYMEHVEDWFLIYEYNNSNVTRQVYLATDEPSVMEEAQKSYPEYKFISDNEISKVASKHESRYTDDALRGVIIDIHFLSRSDFLVCTFSSQVCRVAYELMQPRHGDASRKFKSLDDAYYFGGMHAHLKLAIEDHVAKGREELQLLRGDVIKFDGNHWNGNSMGWNYRTNQRGLFPSYKVRDTVRRVKMPTYDDVV